MIELTVSRQDLDRLDGKQRVRKDEHDGKGDDIAKTETVASSRIPRKTYLGRLKPWSGSYSPAPFWRLTIQPFLILWNPVAVWAVVLFAFPVFWLVAFNLLIAQIFSAPPYLLNTAELGYMSAGAVVGGILSSMLCAAVSDPMIEFFARRNGGIYEPEFRLFLIIPALILTIVAYFPFGYMIRDGKSPAAISTMYGVATAAGQTCMAVVGAYAVDGYRDISVEIFVLTMIIKNFLFYGFSCKPGYLASAKFLERKRC